MPNLARQSSLGLTDNRKYAEAFVCAVASTEGASTSGREYLAYFLHRHLDFRLPELESLVTYEDSKACFSWRKPFGGCVYSPFWYMTLPSDGFARQLCSRSMLLKVLPWNADQPTVSPDAT